MLVFASNSECYTGFSKLNLSPDIGFVKMSLEKTYINKKSDKKS